jgi:hypothetical protein
VQIQNHVRFKKRILCEFQDESGRHIGMALNVFQGVLEPLFVRAAARS